MTKTTDGYIQTLNTFKLSMIFISTCMSGSLSAATLPCHLINTNKKIPIIQRDQPDTTAEIRYFIAQQPQEIKAGSSIITHKTLIQVFVGEIVYESVRIAHTTKGNAHKLAVVEMKTPFLNGGAQTWEAWLNFLELRKQYRAPLVNLASNNPADYPAPAIDGYKTKDGKVVNKFIPLAGYRVARLHPGFDTVLLPNQALGTKRSAVATKNITDGLLEYVANQSALDQQNRFSNHWDGIFYRKNLFPRHLSRQDLLDLVIQLLSQDGIEWKDHRIPDREIADVSWYDPVTESNITVAFERHRQTNEILSFFPLRSQLTPKTGEPLDRNAVESTEPMISRNPLLAYIRTLNKIEAFLAPQNKAQIEKWSPSSHRSLAGIYRDSLVSHLNEMKEQNLMPKTPEYARFRRATEAIRKLIANNQTPSWGLLKKIHQTLPPTKGTNLFKQDIIAAMLVDLAHIATIEYGAIGKIPDELIPDISPKLNED